MADYTDIVVRKPWGFEYLAYEDESMAVWMLHIVPSNGTSLHKHERKDTELTVLQGEAMAEGDGWSKMVGTGETLCYKAGTIHRTSVPAPVGEPMSEDGAWVMEVEKPNDKEDLVRIEDSYGRDSVYEGENCWQACDVPKLGAVPVEFVGWMLSVEDGEVKMERKKRQKVAEYIFNRIAEQGVDRVFGVVGGGAMHLSDAVGNTEGIKFIACHHEQAAVMSAEGYARATGKIGVALVTTGPGGTNAMTGVAGAYIDGIPIIVIAGQVTQDTMMSGTDGLRQKGIQEANVLAPMYQMTKYAQCITDAEDVRAVMDEAIHKCTQDRKAPVFIEVPLDIQSELVEPSELETTTLDEIFCQFDVKPVLKELQQAKRPLIIAGRGVRDADMVEEFRCIVDMLQVPVVLSWSAKDILWDSHELFAGCSGIIGDRAGNFAVGNADFILVLGSRMSIPQVGHNHQLFARGARLAVVDICEDEMAKDTIKIEMPIQAHLQEFLPRMKAMIENGALAGGIICDDWVDKCREWRRRYPVCLPQYESPCVAGVNVYWLIDRLSDIASSDIAIATDMGSSFTATHQGWKIKRGQRLITSSGLASMGWGLPGGVGIASTGRKTIILSGDGGTMMNIQEFATIAHHQLPITTFILDNGGYLTIKLMQRNHFGRFVGSDTDDLSFPHWAYLAMSFGMRFYEINEQGGNAVETMQSALNASVPSIVYVRCIPDQLLIPRNTSEKLPDGTLASKPLEDMYPFLPRDEFKENML